MIKKTPFVLMALIFLYASVSIANDETNEEYFNTAVKIFEEKCKDKDNSEFLKCLAEYTPKKCKELAYGNDRLAWQQCISSCGNANIYSKKIGECSI